MQKNWAFPQTANKAIAKHVSEARIFAEDPGPDVKGKDLVCVTKFFVAEGKLSHLGSFGHFLQAVLPIELFLGHVHCLENKDNRQLLK